MAFYWSIAFIIAFAATGSYLRFASSRARERAGLPARPRVKMPLYWWAFMILFCINSTYLFYKHTHGAP
jgi:hypothetical protein